MGAQLNIIGLIRARNEARWIGRSITSMQPLCSAVVVMDDRSTDGTAEAARRAGAEVVESPFDRFHEANDKQWLYEQVLPRRPDWVLMLDGDEMLGPGCAEKILDALPLADSFSFRIVYLWDREDQARVDRWYAHFTRPSLFRALPGFRFSSTYANGMHCGNTPAGMRCVEIPGDILHFGYLHRADRVRKFHYYNQLDPNNEFEDRYRHIVIGDLPEYPASMAAKWAGPLELRAI